MQTLSALLSNVRLNKKRRRRFKESVAELFPPPATPVAPAPKKSRVEELAHSME
jgi:hypothetical protein